MDADGSITAATRLLALLGDPVAHSLSPVFQNAAIAALERDAVYVALRCDGAVAPALLRGIARAGGGGNVTVPHKVDAMACLDRATAAAQRTGACNTFWLEHGAICGDNTDVAGFRHALSRVVPDPAGADVAVIGAGGAAAAAVCALVDARAGRITLYNRSPDRARSLAARFAAECDAIVVVHSGRELRDRRFDVIVNASSAGMNDADPLPIDLAGLDRPRAVLDLVYRRAGVTRWVAHARGLGIRAEDGIEMLLGQGAAAFERWFDAAAPIDVMRATLRR